MNKEEVLTVIKELISERVEKDVSEISDGSTLMDDIGLSSLEVMTMLADIEEKFSVSIDTEKTSEVATVNDLADLVISCME